MTGILREAIGMSGPSVRELPGPSGETVGERRIGDFLACAQDGAWVLRVLVVDDDHDCADSLSMLVRQWGYDIQTAYNGAAALDMMAARQPEVVLVDVAMPKMDGCRMERRLRRQTRFNHTLLITITGYGDHAHRLLCEKAGFDHFLIKPIELDDLENLLRGKQDRLARFSRRE